MVNFKRFGKKAGKYVGIGLTEREKQERELLGEKRKLGRLERAQEKEERRLMRRDEKLEDARAQNLLLKEQAQTAKLEGTIRVSKQRGMVRSNRQTIRPSSTSSIFDMPSMFGNAGGGAGPSILDPLGNVRQTKIAKPAKKKNKKSKKARKKAKGKNLSSAERRLLAKLLAKWNS